MPVATKCSTAPPRAARPCQPVQLEWQNVSFGRGLAYVGWMMVGNGQGTPRNLGRAKFLITTQQVAIAGRPNS